MRSTAKPVRPAIMRSWVFLFLVSGMILAGCGSCGGVPTRDGAFPYRACLLESGERPRSLRLDSGGTLEIDERAAHFNKSSLRIAAFRGAPGSSFEEISASIREERVDLLLLLGSAGRRRDEIEAQLKALLAIGPPLLLIPGGDDSLPELDRAISALSDDERERLLDGRRLYALHAEEAHVILVPGAPEGRHAYDSAACGYNASDLSARLRGAGARRLFFAWSLAGEAIESLAPEAGVFAFPAEAEREGFFIAGPIAGDPYFTGSGYRAAAPSLISMSARGLTLIGEIEPRAAARMVPPRKP